jgi:hypothetical protein
MFVRADKLRMRANKMFSKMLGEGDELPNNTLIFRYEAQLLRLLCFDVGNVPNPFRVSKLT